MLLLRTGRPSGHRLTVPSWHDAILAAERRKRSSERSHSVRRRLPAVLALGAVRAQTRPRWLVPFHADPKRLWPRAGAAALVFPPICRRRTPCIVRGRAHFKSDTIVAVLQQLPRWPWARALALVPRLLRDFVYDRVAQNRYRLFGRTESCMIPAPAVAGALCAR